MSNEVYFLRHICRVSLCGGQFWLELRQAVEFALTAVFG